MEKAINLIGEIDFKDVKVKVYNDPYTKYTEDDNVQCVWGMRNPDTCYEGVMWMNLETGKISYPEDAVIPEQTEKDREILPRFIITGYDKIDDKFISSVSTYLDSGYKRRNPKQNQN